MASVAWVTKVDRKADETAPPVAIEMYTWPRALYHGSQRLASIHKFIEATKPLLARYLAILHSGGATRMVDDPAVVATWRERVKQLVTYRYERLMPGDFNPGGQPWIRPVVFLYAMQDLHDRKLPVQPISLAVEKVIQEAIRERPWYTNSFLELVEFCRGVEKCRTVAEVEAGPWLHVEFFSVMRLPLQFFSIRETALTYAKGDENQLFMFDLKKGDAGVRLVNISDPNTVHQLMATPDMPFYSRRAYEAKVVQVHTECSFDDFRATTVAEIGDIYREPMEKLRDTFERETKQLEVGWQDYKWKLAAEREAWSDDDEYKARLTLGKSWPDFLREAVGILYAQQREVWEFFLGRAGVASPSNLDVAQESIVQWILTKFPDVNPDNATKFSDFMDSLYWSKSLERNRQHDKIQEDALQTWLAMLDKWFVLRGPDARQKLEQLLRVHRSIRRTSWKHPLADSMSAQWKELYEHEILSPYGIWVRLQWKVLNETGEVRESSYAADTLCAYSLFHSPALRKHNWHGWVSHKPWYEVMLFHPGEHGQMRKLTSQPPADAEGNRYDLDL